MPGFDDVKSVISVKFSGPNMNFDTEEWFPGRLYITYKDGNRKSVDISKKLMDTLDAKTAINMICHHINNSIEGELHEIRDQNIPR